ncbi:uncharacterized protein LOC141901046 [Tubulanus polymorphus]|uniref:uncharacterized protein LOC141901046 n=1 Tax=Tubulanus polymorphus TaxID=672921 RepID=UPI003DA25EE7
MVWKMERKGTVSSGNGNNSAMKRMHIVNPNLDNSGIQHASRLGITLKSQWLPNSKIVHSSFHGRTAPSTFHWKSALKHEKNQNQNKRQEFITDFIMPISAQVDDRNFQTPHSSYSFCSTSRFKQVPLPNVSPRNPSAKTITRPVSICSERYLASTGSVPLRTASSLKSAESRRSTSSRGATPSEQSIRWITEQQAREKSRILKRTTEIKNYRIDQVYHMNGAACNLHPKYMVEEDDLNQLRETAKSRKQIKSSRSAKQSFVNKTIETSVDKKAEDEEQPTSDDHLPPVNSATAEEDNAENTNVDDVGSVHSEGKVSSHSGIGAEELLPVIQNEEGVAEHAENADAADGSQ